MTVAIDSLPSFGVELPPDPYPGLRPFEKHEWSIFFGRERMIDETIERLVRQQMIVVHGDSGCGKSSLIKAGVLARLEQDNARGGVLWRTCEMQPRVAPLHTLATVLASLDGRENDRDHVVEIRRALNFAEAPRRIAELVRHGDMEYVCLLVDQFEELFALARHGGRDEASLFVQILVGLVKQPPPGLYVVATMRSEFLGNCAQFPGFAEAVNEVQYLLPRMAPLDLVRAIREPAPAYNGFVSKELAQRLIADAGGTQDQLPLIQHGLMTLYRRKVPTEARVQAPAWRLDLADYASDSARLAELLSKHADNVADQAEPGNGRIVQKVFRALTEINAEGQAIRRPQSLKALLAVMNDDEKPRCNDILRGFRAEGTSFLRPYGDDPVAPDDIIDISHEALIRSWCRIAEPKDGWLAREFQDGLIWKSLLVQAESFEQNASNVLSPATAAERERWLTLHNAEWAKRYGGGWDRVVGLVKGSVQAAKKQERAARLAARRQEILIASVALLLLLFSSYSVLQNRKTREALTQANAASAASLWNRLDFSGTRTTDDELNALWEIAVGSEDVRQTFIQQLLNESERAARLGRRPQPVTRAVGLQWPADTSAQAFTSAVSQVSKVDASQLTRLGLSAYTLAGLMTPNEAIAALPATVASFDAANEPSRAAAVAYALQGLAPNLGQDDANRTLLSILSKLAAIDVSTTVITSRFVSAASALTKRITQDQARTALATLLDTPRKRALAIDSLIDALVGRLAPESVRQQFVEMIARLSTLQPGTSGSMVMHAGRGIGARLTETDARALFPQWFEGFKVAIAADRITEWATVGTGLVPRLSAEQLKALDVLVASAGPKIDDDEIHEFLVTLGRETTKKLSLEDVRAVTHRIPADTLLPLAEMLAMHIGVHGTTLEAVKAMQIAPVTMASNEDPVELLELRGQAIAIVPRLSAVQAMTAFREVLTQIVDASDSDQLTALGLTAQSLADRLTPAEASSALKTLFEAIPETTPAGVPYLQASAAALIGKLKNSEHQALIAQARTGLSGSRRSSSSVEEAALAIQHLAAGLAPDQIEPILEMLTRELGQASSSETDLLTDAAFAVGKRANAATADRVFEWSFMKGTKNVGEATGFAIAAISVSESVSEEHARKGALALVKAMAEQNSPALLALYSSPVARHLTSADASRVFQSILTAMRSMTDEEPLAVLSSAAEAVAQRLDPAQAREALQNALGSPVLRADPTVTVSITQRRTAGEQSAALFTAGRALLSSVSTSDAENFAPLLLRAAAVTAVASNEERATAAIDSIMQGWSEERTRVTLQRLLAWSTAPAEVNRWTTKLAALPNSQPRSEGIAAVVELLKYPPIAGTPTDQLLDLLKKIDPSAPGKEAGLPATIRWVADTYPAIELDARPMCPPPPSSSLTCPAVRR